MYDHTDLLVAMLDAQIRGDRRALSALRLVALEDDGEPGPGAEDLSEAIRHDKRGHVFCIDDTTGKRTKCRPDEVKGAKVITHQYVYAKIRNIQQQGPLSAQHVADVGKLMASLTVRDLRDLNKALAAKAGASKRHKDLVAAIKKRALGADARTLAAGRQLELGQEPLRAGAAPVADEKRGPGEAGGPGYRARKWAERNKKDFGKVAEHARASKEKGYSRQEFLDRIKGIDAQAQKILGDYYDALPAAKVAKPAAAKPAAAKPAVPAAGGDLASSIVAAWHNATNDEVRAGIERALANAGVQVGGPGYTGRDALGREWAGGKLVAKPEGPKAADPAKKPAESPGPRHLVPDADRPAVKAAMRLFASGKHSITLDEWRRRAIANDPSEFEDMVRYKFKSNSDRQVMMAYYKAVQDVVPALTPPPNIKMSEESLRSAAAFFDDADIDFEILSKAACAQAGATVSASYYGDKKRRELVLSVRGDGMKATRSFSLEKGRLVCSNDFFEVKKNSTVRGYEIFASQVESLRAMGVVRIKTEAAGDGETASQRPGDSLNGYYTWPRLGYSGQIEKDYLAQFDDPVAQELQAKLRGSREILDLFALPGGAEWWKKNGHSLAMTFDLSEGSRSMKVLQKYVEERRAKGG